VPNDEERNGRVRWLKPCPGWRGRRDFYSSFVIRHSSFVIRHSSFVVLPDKRWSSLIPGVIAVAVIVAATVAVLVFARVGALRGERVELFITAPQAGGILSGSDVWLAGRKIGRVQKLSTIPTSADSLARVLLQVEILAKHVELVRRDSKVQVTTGARLLGAAVVAIEGGTPGAPAVRSGDTLHAGQGGMLGDAAAQVAEAREQLPILLSSTRQVMADMKSVAQLAGNAAGRVPVAHAKVVMSDAAKVGGRMSRVASAGRGRDAQALMTRVRTVRARVDSLRVVMASPSGTFGRFRRDSSLIIAMAALRDEAKTLSAKMSSPDGSLGRFAADSAVQREMAKVSLEMSALMADIKRRPLRYLSF
jgi:hypothetical protein